MRPFGDLSFEQDAETRAWGHRAQQGSGRSCLERVPFGYREPPPEIVHFFEKAVFLLGLEPGVAPPHDDEVVLERLVTKQFFAHDNSIQWWRVDWIADW
jgi:hypothetical protein